MRVFSIISEYNPLHNGHVFHIETARRESGCDYAVAVMSGNFVQRGEPALIDKYRRTRLALESGIDMVIELPVYFATASAEYFAHYAVKLLNASGIADTLAFGSESGELSELMRKADALAVEDAGFKSALKAGLDCGLTYPTARAAAVDGAPVSPNDILAVEYLKALRRTGSTIKPLVIKRTGAGYHEREICGSITSATAIRRAFLNGETTALKQAVPPVTYDALAYARETGEYVPGLDAYAEAFRYILRTNTRLDEIMDVSEGLHNRYITMSGRCSLLSEIIRAVKTKRYTHTRLNRAALHMLLGLRRAELLRFHASPPPYIRVLGMKRTAGRLMNALTSNAVCPVITLLRPAMRTLGADGVDMLEKEIISTDVYYTGLLNKNPVRQSVEYEKSFIVV